MTDESSEPDMEAESYLNAVAQKARDIGVFVVAVALACAVPMRADVYAGPLYQSTVIKAASEVNAVPQETEIKRPGNTPSDQADTASKATMVQEIEQAYFSGRYEEVISHVGALDIDLTAPAEQQRLSLIAARAAWQSNAHVFAEGSLLALFQRALDESNGAAAALALLKRLHNIDSAVMLSEALNVALARSAIAPEEAQRLALALPPDTREALETAQEIALAQGDHKKAVQAALRLIEVLKRDGAPQVRMDMAEVRMAAIAGRAGLTDLHETTLAGILSRTPTIPPPILAQAYTQLGISAMRGMADTETMEAQQRHAEAEASTRFFRAGVDVIEGMPGKSATALRKMLLGQLGAPFDLTGGALVQRVPRPGAEASASDWQAYATSQFLLGAPHEALGAARQAFDLSRASGDRVGAIEALQTVLPKLAGLLTEAEIETLFSQFAQIGVSETGDLPPSDRLAAALADALKWELRDDMVRASQSLAAFLLTEPRPELPQPRGGEAYAKLAVTAFNAGLFEMAGQAIDIAIDAVPEASARQALINIARSARIRPFSRHARDLKGFDFNDAQALPRLRTLTQLNAPWLEQWGALTASLSWIRRADLATLQTIGATDYALILDTYRNLDATLKGAPEQAMMRAHFAVAAAHVVFSQAHPEWSAPMRETLQAMQVAAVSGDYEARILRHNTERQIAAMLEDWRHVARAAAGVSLELMSRANTDITDQLLEIWGALRAEQRMVEAGFFALLVGESLSVTRRRMSENESRKDFFRSRFLTFDRILHGLEQDIKAYAEYPNVQGYFISLYWELTERIKTRFIYDRSDGVVDESRAEAEQIREAAFFDVISEVLRLYMDENPAWPDGAALEEALRQGGERYRAQLDADLEQLATGHPARVEATSLAEVQAALSDDTAVLIINARPVHQDDYGGLVLVRRDALDFAPLSTFRWEIDVIRPLLKDWSGGTPKPALSQRRALFEALIQPFEDQLAGVSRLIVTPSGPFGVVPYGALWDDMRGQNLVERFTIALTPSSKLLASRTVPPQTSVPQSLLFAVNPFGGKMRALAEWQASFGLTREAATVVRQARDLSRFATREAQVLQRAWPFDMEVLSAGGNIAGADLTLDSLRAALPQSDAAHISMHGVLPLGTEAADALLYLSPQEGFLSTSDLEGVDLSGLSSIVLSACEVGRGYTLLQESALEAQSDRWLARLSETAGFPTEMLLMGASTVVAPIDAVNAEQDALLWTVYYQELAQGARGSDALAVAQRARIAAQDTVERDWGLYIAYGQ